MARLQGKVALVTGASRGIGAGIARVFASEGARVALAARTVERLEAVAAEIGQAGGEALPVETDVSRVDDIRSAVEQTVERFGGLDVLVNNAAVTTFSRTMDAPDLEAEYDRLMATNLKSAFMGIHFALPHMKERGAGSVINISSVHGTASGGHMSAYAASKGALHAGTRALGVELAPLHIRVNCIAPGRIWLDEPGGWMRRRLGDAVADEVEERFGDWLQRSRTLQQPLPVEGRPEDVAWCAVYLASDEARFVTGATFHVDGGMTALLADPAFAHPGAQEQAEGNRKLRDFVREARERHGGTP